MSQLLCYTCVLVVAQVSSQSVTMSKWIKRGNYNHEYQHKQSQYVVKDYSRYILQLKDGTNNNTVLWVANVVFYEIWFAWVKINMWD